MEHSSKVSWAFARLEWNISLGEKICALTFYHGSLSAQFCSNCSFWQLFSCFTRAWRNHVHDLRLATGSLLREEALHQNWSLIGLVATKLLRIHLIAAYQINILRLL